MVYSLLTVFFNRKVVKMTEIKPYMCSCCNDVWSRENQKNIKLGKYELHLCPDCYNEYIISNNAVLEQIRAEIEQVEINGHIRDVECFRAGLNTTVKIIDKYKEKGNRYKCINH